MMSYWLGLVIGNSRLHWAMFKDDVLGLVWDSEHLSEKIDTTKALVKILPQQYKSNISEKIQQKNLAVYLASVVPEQTLIWQNYPAKKILVTADLPLRKTYSSLGIDRALAVCGAGEIYNYPCLVIDAGTALTFTAVDEKKNLVGGAILPGLGLQLRSLYQQTSALPQVSLTAKLPNRWALTTEEAITSGIAYTLIAGIYSYIEDWLAKYSNSLVIFTGGDSTIIFEHIANFYPHIADSIILDHKLIFWGLKVAKNSLVS